MTFKQWLIERKVWQKKDTDFEYINKKLGLPVGSKTFIESNSNKLVIVDVQPAYQNYISFMDRFGEFVNSYSEILVLFNGPDLGMDSKSTIANFYLKNGVKRDVILKMKWHEKNYGFFRDLMDSCYLREDIVKIIRYMLRMKKNDIQDLTEEDIEKINISNLIFGKLKNYGFYIVV